MVTKHLVRLGLAALVAPALAAGITVGSVALTGSAQEASVAVAQYDGPAECQDEYDTWQAAKENHSDVASDKDAAKEDKEAARQAKNDAKAAYDECLEEHGEPGTGGGGEPGDPKQQLCDADAGPLSDVQGALCSLGGEPPAVPDLPSPEPGGDPKEQLCDADAGPLSDVQGALCSLGGEPPAPGDLPVPVPPVPASLL